MSKANFVNQSHIEGVLYEHDLAVKVSGSTSKNPGVQFISGTIGVATDDNITNIVTVHFSYVTATTKNGKSNDTYVTLDNIINGIYGTYMRDGAEKAIKVRIDSAIDLNEFYSDRNGKTELVSVKRNEGGFVHKVDILDPDEGKRSTFKTDMVIKSAIRVEADEEHKTPEKMTIKGAIFNYRKDLLPVEYTIYNPKAMDYFDSLDISDKNPIFTNVWGRQLSTTTVREIRTESAFGEDEVREVKNTRKEFVVTGASRELPPWDDPSTITVEELNAAIQKREIELAALKTRQDEYKASRNTVAPAATPATGVFNF